MNEPRTLPYAFRVFEFAGGVYLYDDSVRSFPCTAVPHIAAEELYGLCNCGDEDGDCGDVVCCRCNNGVREGDALFLARDVEGRESFPIELDDEYAAAAVPEGVAWDAAREEANANCRI
jgi:hypothetical protein